MPFIGQKFRDESEDYFAEKKRLKELEEEVARLKNESSAERDATPTRQREMTLDELRDFMYEHKDKVSIAMRRPVANKTGDLEELRRIAKLSKLSTKRDATPPAQRMNAAQQAAEAAAENARRAAAGRSTRTTTPGKQRPTSTKNATPPRKRAMTDQELRDTIKANPYLAKEKLSGELKDDANTDLNSLPKDRLHQILNHMGLPLERDQTPPRASSSSISVQDLINELEENIKANTSPGVASGTSSQGRHTSPQRANTSWTGETSNQSPAPATQRTPSGRRATFAPEVNQSRHASRSRSGTPSQNQSYDAMHEFAERARASSAPRSRTPAEIREEDAFIPNYDWENPFSYDNSVHTDAEIAEMERANAASQTTRESIGSIEDEHKNIMKLAHKQYAKPHQVWKVNPVAELSPAQKEYRRNLKRDSPYSEEAQEERAATVDALTPYLTDRTQTEIMEPYVENMTQDPGRLYKELMEPTEKEHLQSVYDEANDNFTKKILPGIRARYHVPGLRQHGQMRSDLNNATQRFGKGVGSAVAEHKGAFRKMGFEVAQRHAGLQGQAADLMSKGAESQRHNNLQAFGALREFKKQDNAEKNLFNQQVNVMGTADRQRDQDRINEQKNRFTEAQEAPARKLGQLADIQNKYQYAQPIAMQSRTPSSAGQVEKELASTGMSAAGMLFNQAMNPQPQTNRGHFKTGGRVKKAFGGIVNPAETAIDNAVVQKTSPIYELRRLLNLPDPVQQYAVGGLVSPITAGAQEAQQYAGHAAMKNKLQRMRQPAHQIGIMGALADATGDSSGQGWLGQSLKAFHSGYSRQDQRRLAQQQRVDSADDLEYKLQGDLEEKAHKERDMARQEKIAEAQIAKYRLQGEAAKAKNAELTAASAGIDPDDLPTKPQKPSDLAAIDKAKHRFAKILEYKKANEEIEELAPGVDSGPLQDVFGDITSRITPWFGKGSHEERLALKNAGANTLNAYTAMQDAGGGRSVAHLNQKKEDKPGLNKHKSHNLNKAGKSADAATEDLKVEIEIMKSHGASRKVIKDFIAKAERKKPNAQKVVNLDKPVSEMTEEEIAAKIAATKNNKR